MFRCTSCGAFNRVSASSATGAVPVCGKCKRDLDASGAPQNVDAAAFERVVASSPVPVLVDFWAPWCGPCRAAAPILERVGQSEAGRLVVLKLNTDEHPEPSVRLGVRGIPTFMLFNDGREVSRVSGVRPEAELRRWVQSAH